MRREEKLQIEVDEKDMNSLLQVAGDRDNFLQTVDGRSLWVRGRRRVHLLLDSDDVGVQQSDLLL